MWEFPNPGCKAVQSKIYSVQLEPGFGHPRMGASCAVDTCIHILFGTYLKKFSRGSKRYNPSLS